MLPFVGGEAECCRSDKELGLGGGGGLDRGSRSRGTVEKDI